MDTQKPDDFDEYFMNPTNHQKKNKKRAKKKKDQDISQEKQNDIVDQEQKKENKPIESLNSMLQETNINIEEQSMNSMLQPPKEKNNNINKREYQSFQPYPKQKNKQRLKIDNIFMFNNKFGIPRYEPCMYILIPGNPTLNNNPLSTEEIKNLYIAQEIEVNYCQFRPFDFFVFKNYKKYFYLSIRLIDEPNWVDQIILNEQFNFLFGNPMNNMTLNLNESFIPKTNNESIGNFMKEEDINQNKLYIQNKEHDESKNWILVDSKKNKKPQEEITKKSNVNQKIIGLNPQKKKSKQKKNTDDELIDKLRPKNYGFREPDYNKFLEAFNHK